MSGPAPIVSLSNPRVKQVVKWRKPRDRRAAGVVLAEGSREVDRALGGGLSVVELFATEAFWDAPDRPDFGGVSPTRVSEAVLAKMAYHDRPEGLLAVFRAPAWSLEALPDTPGGLYLVAVGTEKPGNLGAMVRTAAAAGCAAVIAADPAVDVFNPNAVRNSTGAVFSMPTVTADADAALDWLQNRGVRVAAALADGGDDCFAASWAEPGAAVAVVVGPEHAGLDARWREAADVGLTIPAVAADVDSLNASNAAAVLLFEAVRRRRLG